jgi:hypothetical protein
MENIHSQTIANYTPQSLDADAWTQISGFVRASVAHRFGTGQSRRQTQHALSTMAAFADWVLLTGVARLDESALRENVIDAYTYHRTSEVDGPVAERERKRLRVIAGLRNFPEKRAVATTATPSAPYTADEVDGFRQWALWQPNDYRAGSAQAVAALGLGCGLTLLEMMHVRGRDIITLDDGLLGVQLLNRTVPVLADWNEELGASRGSDLDRYLVSPESTQRTGQSGTSVMKMLGPNSPSPQRMRATWLLAHVEASTNIYSLMAAAGLSAPDFLRRLAGFAAFTPASKQPAVFRLSTEVN